MPNKAVEAAEAIKAAWEATREIVNPISIYTDTEGTRVHVMDMRDLEQIPGTLEFKERDEDVYTHNASKTICGVKFFCLLTQEEYEAAKMREAS